MLNFIFEISTTCWNTTFSIQFEQTAVERRHDRLDITTLNITDGHRVHVNYIFIIYTVSIIRYPKKAILYRPIDLHYCDGIRIQLSWHIFLMKYWQGCVSLNQRKGGEGRGGEGRGGEGRGGEGRGGEGSRVT